MKNLTGVQPQDENGRWFWYECKPGTGGSQWIVDHGKYTLASSNWAGTLEERGRYQ